MISATALLQIHLLFKDYQAALLCFVTAFVVTLILVPFVISFMIRHQLSDIPNERKEHLVPVPTMGGIAIVAGLSMSMLLWFPFTYEPGQVAFFFSVAALTVLGIMDDTRDLPAKYKFMIQFGLALLVSLSGIRITSFGGLLGIDELPVSAQYFISIISIVGITNAFNLVDGIDGLAGGLAFMSLTTLGIFLMLSGDGHTALIAFGLAGAVAAFLYFNLNPARIFMGDTGSLVLGFVIAVLCIRLLQVNNTLAVPLIPHAPVFVLGLVLIPVFDTLRVFSMRTWSGKSPFMADRTHIHHLLTNEGFGHAFAARLIYFVHGAVLLVAILLNELRQELTLIILLIFMVIVALLLKNLRLLFPRKFK